MSDITVTHCPQCGHSLQLAEHPAGKTVAGPVATTSAAGFQVSAEVKSETVPLERLGRYRILSELGSGGFATVYLAFDESLQRRVAVKVPRRDRFQTEADFLRFLDEARVLARFDHPGIVPVHDVGSHGDVHFIVTQYADGCSLSQKMRQGRLPFTESARIVMQCADAIHAAHKRQIYHRDLKPGNILLTSDGRALVADFGLAISRDNLNPLLREFSGTPRYMSPEQIRGNMGQLDGRSDLWSLGVILYRLLTEQDPFIGEGHQLGVEIQEKAPVPLRQHDEQIPVRLEAICLQCIRKLPEERYQTGHDLARDLEAWLQDQSSARASGTGLDAAARIRLSEETAEGRSHSTQPVRNIRPPARRAGMVVAAGMAGTILYAASDRIFPGRPDQKSGEPVGTSASETVGAAAVSQPVPGKWFQLLSRPPEKLIFPSSGPARLFYSPTTEELTLHTPEAGYVSLLESRADSFRYSVRLHRSGWLGDAGLFWGYRPLRWSDGRTLNQCLAVYVRGVQLKNREPHFSLRLDRLVVTPSAHMHDDVSPGAMLQIELPFPRSDITQLEVSIVQGRLQTVFWDGQRIVSAKELAGISQDWMTGLPQVTGSGQLGVFSRDGDTVFSDARFQIDPNTH